MSSHWSRFPKPKSPKETGPGLSLDSHWLFSLQSFSTDTKSKLKMYALSKSTSNTNKPGWISRSVSYRKLFPKPEVYEFIKNKPVSVGSCEGYFLPSLLATTAYLLACNHARVEALTHDRPLNIYTIFVGYPGTGRFIAHNYTLPLEDFQP